MKQNILGNFYYEFYDFYNKKQEVASRRKKIVNWFVFLR